MKAIIREFLSYSKTEQRGIIVLCSLIILIQAIRYFYPYFQSDDFPVAVAQQADTIKK